MITEEFDIKLTQNPTSDAERSRIVDNPEFGKHFTDHMAIIDYDANIGWHDPRILPYGPITLDPAAAVLHYGQEVFEGLKVYKREDSSIWAFRAEVNAQRMNHSAKRIALPELPEDLFLESLKQLALVDREWVSTKLGQSLYMRPFMIATEPFLGVRPAKQIKYLLIASPAGSYFDSQLKPINIWLSENFARAAFGGTGSAKFGGNYAASLVAQQEAEAHGCQQVCFLDSNNKDLVEELGAMNIFFVFKDGSLVTPQLNGNILPGVTRDSVINIAKGMGLQVEERDFSIVEWKSGIENGDITEIFACGTAAIIVSIGKLRTAKEDIGDFVSPGKLTMELRKKLLDIQYHMVEDSKEWMTRLV